MGLLDDVLGSAVPGGNLAKPLMIGLAALLGARAVGGSSTPTATARETPNATGNAVFPTAVSPKYSSESPGKARMHTCLDQYNADKANNILGGLKWIQKGGGYYSQCNRRLKG